MSADPGSPRPGGSRPGSAGGARRQAAVLLGVLLLLVQAANFALSERSILLSAWGNRQKEAAGIPLGGIGYLPFAAYRGLAELAPQIPTDGRVLLVAGSEAPVAYDFHLLPRPLHVLLTVNDTMVERVERVDPVVATHLAAWHARLESRDQRLSAEALARHLPDSDWLVTVQIEAETLPWPAGGPALHVVARHGPVTLSRILRSPR